jgi:predicted ABC-class ATPase
MSSPDVQSLATLLADHRDWLHETSLIIAGSGLELLIAQADRIIRLEKHRVYAQSVTGYREGLRDFFDTLSKFIP